MKEITQFAEHTVEIWRRPRQRHMNLRVRPDGHLRVTCNKRMSQREIFQFIRDSEAFIKKSLQKISEHKTKFPPKRYVSGETFLYFGERLVLEVVWSWASRIQIKILPGQIEMVAPLTSTGIERQQAWHKFLITKARKIFADRVQTLANHMQLFPKDVSIRGQRTRWGSCSSQGRVNFNWKLMAAPQEIIDYVVIHELAHLKHMDHSPRFWSLVEQYFKEHRRAKQWLSTHEPEIAVQFQKISNAGGT